MADENPGAMPLIGGPEGVGGRAYALSAADWLFPNMSTMPGDVWIKPPLLSAKVESKLSRRQAVIQSRAAVRRNEHLRGPILRKADMVVGASLRVHPQPDWEMLGIEDKAVQKDIVKQFQRQFLNWAYDGRALCDGEGHYNFGGLMWLSYVHLAGPDAETALTVIYDQERADKYFHRWATYVNVIDTDRIETPAEFAGDENVIEGKRVDENGRMIGMYVLSRHPSEGYSVDKSPWTYIPRETPWGRAMAIHWFLKTRAGQQRGISSLVTVLKQTNMLDKFDDAYLGAAIVNQVLNTYVKTMGSAETVAQQLAPMDEQVGIASSTFGKKLGYYDKTKMRVGGSRIPVMPPGDEIVMSAVDRANGDPSAFRNGFLREFASAIGVSFEQLSMNFSEANYSSARAALLETWRGVLTLRRLFTGHVASLIYAAVIEEAFAKGYVTLPPGIAFLENRTAWTGCTWTGPGMGWIDPQKEAGAIEKLISLKQTSRQRVAAERGDDWFEILAEIKSEQDEAEEADVELTMSTADQSDQAAADAADQQTQADDARPNSSMPSTPAQE